jgi:hypothetical protein
MSQADGPAELDDGTTLTVKDIQDPASKAAPK